MGLRDDRLATAAQMPHRAFAADKLAPQLESEIGRLFYKQLISLSEYEAGVRYASITLEYLRTTDAPEPYGNEFVASLDDDLCLRRKINMASAREVLKRCDERASRIVDRVAVYDEPLRDGELFLLRAALRALAGV